MLEKSEILMTVTTKFYGVKSSGQPSMQEECGTLLGAQLRGAQKFDEKYKINKICPGIKRQLSDRRLAELEAILLLLFMGKACTYSVLHSASSPSSKRWLDRKTNPVITLDFRKCAKGI